MSAKQTDAEDPGGKKSGANRPAQLHPVVAEFEAHPTGFIDKMGASPRDPAAAAIVRLSRALYDETGGREKLASVRGMDLAGCDPGLAVLLLQAWAKLATHLDRPAEAATVLKRARLLLSPDMPAGLHAVVRFAEAILASHRGDVRSYGGMLEETLELLPESSPHYPLYLINYALHLAQMGRATEVRPRLERLLAGNPRTIHVIDRINFIDALECCRIEEAVRLHPLVSQNVPRLVGYDRTYEFLFDVLRDKMPAQAAAPYDSQPGSAPEWTAVVDHLFARRPARALELARRLAAASPRQALSVTRFDAFNLIRTELANGRGEAARRLVAMRREIGNPHHLDDLFLARADLLAGDRAAAARRFAAVDGECRRLGASGRVDFELQLACELQPRDLAFLLSAGGEAGRGARRAGPSAAAEPSAEGVPDDRPAVGVGRLIGPSPAMVRIRESLGRLAGSDLPVLITGETGTGKEVVARALHEASPRAARPLVTVNCGAIPDSLLESELFGHARGAFTGADRAARGLFLEAADGDILLDEIGEISPRLQVALLRVLESGEVRPVGAPRAQRIRCRVLASTNADLSAAVEKGRFRRDLFYRLRRLLVHIPPLGERREDIVPLARHFLNEGRPGGEAAAMEPELEAELARRDWPGNARELRNAMERLRLLNSDGLRYSLASWRRSAADEPEAPATEPARAADPDALAGETEAAPDTHPVSTPAPAADVATFLREGRTQFRRLDRLRELFRRHGKLSRTEAARILCVSLRTATMDLKVLCREGLVEKVAPTASPRTHYFRTRDGAGG